MKINKSPAFYNVVLLNLIIGLYNLYLYVQGDLLFNLIVGSLNIGLWLFFRKK